jgi:valyl-tRNA synthetase
MMAPWPGFDASQIEPAIEQDMEFLQSAISAVRTIRSEMNLPPSKALDVVINCHDDAKQQVLDSNRPTFERMAKLNSLTIGMNLAKPGFSASSVVQGQEVFVQLKGLIDLDVEQSRLEKEISRIEGQLKGVQAKLETPNFSGKAPAEVIQKEKDKQENFRRTIEKLKASLGQLSH